MKKRLCKNRFGCTAENVEKMCLLLNANKECFPFNFFLIFVFSVNLVRKEVLNLMLEISDF